MIKERDATIADISEKLTNKIADYDVICEKLTEVQSTAEMFGKKNQKLKLEHEKYVEDLQEEVQKLKRDG